MKGLRIPTSVTALAAGVALTCRFVLAGVSPPPAQVRQNIPVSAPIDTSSAGKGGIAAVNSVLRVICPSIDSAGTGFLLKGGKVVTAEHVVRGASDIILILSSGKQMPASLASSDPEVDLALLSPRSPIQVPVLQISSRTDFDIGTQVTTWGFPGGYGGTVPLLSVGYLSGVVGHKTSEGKLIRQWMVNAAFNRGNSGGPLLELESGTVIGVVASKLAPITPATRSALDALANQNSGFTYQATRPDGTSFTVTEGQVIAQVLNELREQVQLVIGQAVTLEDLRGFLSSQGIEP